MLSHSWQCKPLETSSQSAAIPGTLCAIWSLRAAAARRLFFTARHLVSSVPPPLLLIHHGGSCLRYPQVDAPGLIAWQAFLGDLLNERTSAPSEAFPVQLPAAAEQFVQNAALAAAEQPAAIRPWLEWTAELLPRLFMALMIPMTLTINKRRTQKLAELARKYPNAESRETAGYNVEKQAFEKTLPVSIPALAFDHALLLSRWLLQEHCQAVQKLAESRPNAPVTDNTDNDGLMQGILCKLHAHGPLTPRHLQRSFHHLTARERDDAIETLKKQGLVRQSEDGSLAIVS